jgi:hypothetical protein
MKKPCLICGRVDDKPMCYRGEPWCCNRHRKAVLAMSPRLRDELAATARQLREG